MADEVKDPKEEKSPATQTEKKETPAPKKEEGTKQFLSDFDEDAPEVKPADKPADTKESNDTAPKFNSARYKELFGEEEDLDTEDKVFESVKKLKETNKKLSLIAKGNRLIAEDKDIKDWNTLLSLKDEDLVKEGLVFNFMQAGYNEEKAKEKAADKIAKALEAENDFIEEESLKLRAQLRGSISSKAEQYQKQLEEAEKTLPQTTKKEKETLSVSVREKIQGKENFLGLELGADAESIKKIRGKAEKLLDDKKFTELLKDPDFLADAFFLHANKKGLEKAITDRQPNTRASMLDKVNNAVPVNRPNHMGRTDQQTNTKKTFNPSKFR